MPPKSKFSALQKRILKASTATFAMRIYAMAINLALWAFLARKLAPAELATLMVAVNTIMFISILAMGGLNQSILRFVSGLASSATTAERGELIRRLAIVWLSFAIVVCVGGWLLLGSTIGSQLGFSQTIVRLVFACGAALSLEQILAVVIRSFHAMPMASLLDGRNGGAFTKTIFFGLCAGLVYLASASLTSQACLYGLLTSLCIACPFGIFLARVAWQGFNKELAQEEAKPQKTVGEVFKDTGFRNIVTASLALLGTQILVFLIVRSDVWMVGAYASNEDAASLYTTARWLILQSIAPLQILNVAISSSIAQLYSEGRKKELEGMLQSSATLCSAVTLPVLLVFAVFNEQVLAIVYGDFYRSAGIVLAILTVGQAFNTVTGNSQQTLVLSGKIRAVFIVNLLAAFAQVLAGWWSVTHYGIVGLAVATTIVTTVQSLVIWLLAKKLAGVWTHPTLTPWKSFKNMR